MATTSLECMSRLYFSRRSLSTNSTSSGRGLIFNELRTANRELAAIGRNINQLTKALNRSIELDFNDQVSHQHLIELKTEIEKNRSAINKLVKVSNGVWETEP